MKDQNIIIHESDGNENIWDVIHELYPYIETEQQLNAMYLAIFLLNKHTRRFDNQYGESFYQEDKKLLDKSHIILPDYNSALYGSIMGFENPDFTTVKNLSLLVSEEFKFFEKYDFVNENIHKSLNTIGFVNMIGVSEALEEIGTELRMRDQTTYLKTGGANVSNNNSPAPIPPPISDSFMDGLLKEYSISNIAKDSGKALIEQSGAAVAGIANKIKELDYMLIQYSLTKNNKKKQLKMDIMNKYAQLQKLIPSYVQKKIALKAKRLPNKSHGAQALHNIKEGIKKAQHSKMINKGLKDIIQEYGKNEVKLKHGNFFERYSAAKNKSKIINNLDNHKFKKKLVITNSEYSNRLKLMNKASPFASKIVIGIDVYLGINEIEKAYVNDEDWIRKTVEVSGGFGVGIGVGVLYGSATAPVIGAVGGGLVVAIPLTVTLAAAGVGLGIAAGYVGTLYAAKFYDEIKKMTSKYKNDNFIKNIEVIYVPIYN